MTLSGKRSAILAATIAIFFTAPALAADLYVSGKLLNSFTRAKGNGDIFLGGGTTPLFSISDTDKDSSPGYGGAVGFGFGIDELRADIRGFELPHWMIRMELEGVFGREYDFQFETDAGGAFGSGDAFFTEIDSWSVMTNVWLDVPVQRLIAPFGGRVPILQPLAISVGGGMGLARAKFETTDNVSSGSDSVNRFAYQGGLGLTYKLNQWATVDAGYRYFDMGDLETKVLFGDNVLTGRQEVELVSHELIAGLRIAFYQAPLEDMAPRKWDLPHFDGGPRWWRRSKRSLSRMRWPRWLGGDGF